MTYLRPVERRCDCRCPVHHGYERTNFKDDGCACTITCATQPMTLLAEQFNCALFLDVGGDLWHVPGMHGGQWKWSSAGQVDGRHDFYETGCRIEQLLRMAGTALHDSISH